MSGSCLFAGECEKLYIEDMQHSELLAVILLPKIELWRLPLSAGNRTVSSSSVYVVTCFCECKFYFTFV